MKIFTSYLANVKNLHKDFFPVFIASKWPSEQLFAWYKPLAPNLKLIGSYIRKEISKEEYTPIYNKMLEGLDVHEVVKDLEFLSKGKNVVLICYEKPEEFCHRHLVSAWLNKNGIYSEEYSHFSSFIY